MKSFGDLVHNPRLRALPVQGLVLAVLVVGAVQTVSANLARLGISSGFGFLSREGHFGIGQALIAHSDSSTHLRAFQVAVLNTLLVAVLSIVTATILGFAVGLMRVSDNPLFFFLGRAFVEVNRNIPLLLHILFWYFIILTMLPVVRESLVLGDIVLNRRGLYLPKPGFDPAAGALLRWLPVLLLGLAVLAWIGRGWQRRRGGRGLVLMAVALLAPLAALALTLSLMVWEAPEFAGLTYRGGLRMRPELVALWLCLTLSHSGYIAEIVRSGVQSVDKVQYEAAGALTFSRRGMYRHVVIPQAARVILPPYAGQALNIIKDTSLGAAIGYPELMQVFWSTVLVQTGQGIKVVIITPGTYLTISLIFALLITLYSRHYAIPGR